MNEAQRAALSDLTKMQQKYYSQVAYSPYQDSKKMEQLKDMAVKEIYESYYSSDSSFNYSEKDIEDNIKKTLNNERPTIYENPVIYKSLIKSAKKIEDGISKLEMKMEFPLIFGTLQTPELNACVWLSSRQDCCIIGLNAGLIGYLYKMAKLIYRSIEIEDKGEGYACYFEKKKIDSFLDKNSELFDQMLQIIDAMIMRGNVYDSPKLKIDYIRDTMATRLLKNAELFIVGHEYGHVLNGDISSDKTSKQIICGIEFEKMNLSWEEEFDADIMGTYLTLTSQMMDFEENREDIANIYIGIDFFFSSLNILEEALSLLTYGTEKEWNSKSHPSSFSRRAHLRDNLFQLLLQMTEQTEKERKFMEKNVESAIVLYDSVQYIIDSLWEKSKEVYLEYHKKGLKPALIWTT